MKYKIMKGTFLVPGLPVKGDLEDLAARTTQWANGVRISLSTLKGLKGCFKITRREDEGSFTILVACKAPFQVWDGIHYPCNYCGESGFVPPLGDEAKCHRCRGFILVEEVPLSSDGRGFAVVLPIR